MNCAYADQPPNISAYRIAAFDYGVLCLACGRTENLVHRFWTCPHSMSAWLALSELNQFQMETPLNKLRCHVELKGWLLDWIGKASSDQVSWMITMFVQPLARS
jgi:hypothetical protein